ncbi:class I SAM-dependent methyltransferase [Shimia ponticola]|uniref:class I SAM-dependent methyltransferase n=1 Tax=Shimia ponticola TaxID=2582893 RepID=UPI002103B5E6|nr:SAM-dependent methyltransferase [Shimia ponticola]
MAGPHMTLRDLLISEISANGPLTLAQFMERALLDPDHGYYSNRDPLGQAGDFTTAPEISQMFGELLGLALAQSWLDQGAPSPFVLAELGPGRGTLMADILRATAAVPGFAKAAQVTFVEQSPVLRTAQATRVPDANWVTDIDDLPDGPLFLIANEFFDALPIHQFRRDGQAWREKLVGIHAGALVFGWSEATRQRALAPRLADTKDGDIVEYCPEAQRITAKISERLQQCPGAAVIIDYGDWRSLGDTFQALANHQTADPLSAPGTADLTAHVDFAALSEAALGTRVSRMTPQGVFLERLGITPRAQTLARQLTGPALDAHIAAHRRLTHPDEMGHLFKGIALVPTGAAMVPGFDGSSEEQAGMADGS